MIEPPPERSRWGIWWCRHRNTPVRLTERIRCQVAGLVATGSVSAGSRMPALLWQTSITPWRGATGCNEVTAAAPRGAGSIAPGERAPGGTLAGEARVLAGPLGGGPRGGRGVDVGYGDEA